MHWILTQRFVAIPFRGGHGGAANAKQSSFMTSLAYDFMFDTLTKNASSI